MLPWSGLIAVGDELEQRRLAGAVDAHDAPALAAPDMEVEALVDRALAIAFVDLPQHHHVLAGAGRRAELEVDLLLAARRLDLVDLVELLDPALHLRGVAGARLEALDEGDLLGQHRLLAVELRLHLLFAERALLLVELVVAAVAGERAAIDLDDLGDDAVHELAVVRGHQQAALVALEEVLEPDEAFEIEVVARLVEQQRVGAHEENLGERDAHLPAAGQCADIAVHHRLAEAEAVEDFAGAGIEAVAVELLELALHLAVAGDDLVHLVGAVGVGHGGFELGELAHQRTGGTGAFHDFGDGAAALHVADVLAEVADGDAAIDGDLALVGLLLAGDQAEQRGLAGAVGTDEADLLAALQSRRRLDEDDLLAVLFADAFETDHRGYATRSHVGEPGGDGAGEHEGESLVAQRERERHLHARSVPMPSATCSTIEQRDARQPAALPAAPDPERAGVEHDDVGDGAVDELHGERVLEQVLPPRVHGAEPVGNERAIHQRPGVVAHARIEPGDERPCPDLEDDEDAAGSTRPRRSSARAMVRPGVSRRATQTRAMNSSSAAVRCAARRYCETLVSVVRPEVTIHQPSAPWRPPRTKRPASGAARFQVKRRWNRKTRNGTAKTRPMTRPRARWNHSQKIDELELVERHALVEHLVLRDLLVGLELGLPVGVAQRRDDAGDRLPLGDRQAGFGQAREAADHDHRQHHQRDDIEPDADGLQPVGRRRRRRIRRR